METRTAKVNFSLAGGTAGVGAKTCKVTLPNAWLAQLGIDQTHRQIELRFDGSQITLAPYLDFDQFMDSKKARGHRLSLLRFYDGNRLCSTIVADMTDHSLRVRNEDVELIKTAFGEKSIPSWDDLEHFLEERCVPRERSGIRGYLDAIGVLEYDPLEIIRKTRGCMAEDQQWLDLEEIP